MSLLIRQCRDALRAIPADNPGYGPDALLILRDALREAAIVAATFGAARGTVEALLDLSADAERLAPVFAEPAAARPLRLDQAADYLRREPQA